MGLDVMIYTDATPYECTCLKKVGEIEVYWEEKGTCMVSGPDYIEPNELDDYKKVTFDSMGFGECEKQCSTREDVSFKSIDIGRISHYDHNGVFKPGQMVECKNYDGFYFGSMGKCRMIGEIVDNYCREKDIANPMAEMNWSEGFYSGKFLYWLKRQLGLVVHLHPQLEVYKKLLETVSDEDLMNKCVVIHC